MVEKRLHSENKLDSYLLRPRLYISLAISSQDDYSRIGLGGNMTVKEAWKIASAPTYGSLFMLVVLTFLTPFLRTGLLGMLIHLYLFAGTALVLVPSSSDYHAVVHAVIIQSNVHPFYYLWSTAVFATGFSVSMSVDFNALTSLITGVMLTLVYFFLLITVTVFLDPRFDQLNIIEDDFGRDMKTLEQQLNEQQFFLME